jgi:medium-chain acyl-[acyl-carrier-protein] hydrolase
VTLPDSLRRHSRGTGPYRARLFCFSYAGGGAYAYRRWLPWLREDVDLYAIQLPGREDRIREPLPESLETTVEQLAADLAPFFGEPCAFFGHSLGAVLATEVARHTPGELVHLFVSGCPALPSIKPPAYPIHSRTDAELLDHIRQLGGTPEELLRDPDIVDFLLRTVRADYALLETYDYKAARMLACPITVLIGGEDPTTSPDNVTDWQAVTTGPLAIHTLRGDHFFVRSSERDVLRLVMAALP